MATLAEAIQSVLTQGIDAAKSIKLAQLQVSNPTPNTSAPSGQGSQVGQAAPYYGVAQLAGQIPPIVMVGGLVLVGVLIFKLVRR